jgi:formylglycine-generating enzyme required for sulfatase activity
MQFRMGFMGLWTAVALVLFTATAFAAPVVSNVSATQRTDGSGLVDVYYDLANGGTSITVEIAISSDGGATWAITPVSVSGDIGAGVTNGTDKHILWDGMADSPDVCWQETRFRVTATDNEITILLPNDVTLVLVRIPKGTFMMGRYVGEQDSYADEDPQHEVTISQDFYIGRYEVTQQQWLAVMSDWPGYGPNTEYGLGNNYPAYYLRWSDAQSFTSWLNGHITNTGQGPLTVRLPTEAEWEYACRAGTTTRFYWGDDLDYTQINSYAAINSSQSVGGKLGNDFGLYDMSGNVWEWCWDLHGAYPSDPVLDPTGAISGTVHSRRGSSWNDSLNLSYCRSACRSGALGEEEPRYRDTGFRIAASITTNIYSSSSIAFDTEKPFVTLLGESEATIECGSMYIDAGATATDVCDGNLTSSIVPTNPVNTNVPGTYTVRYNVSDAAMNAATEVTRTVNIQDTTPPVITLTGNPIISIAQGDVYTDAGATALDACDGNLMAFITVGRDIVDTSTTGTYIITYNVSDSSGNAAAEVTRTVRVVVGEFTIMLPGDVPLELVRIPSGDFMMGRISGEQNSYSDEDPRHEVIFAKDFYMGKYEVTQQQWLAVMVSWPGTAPSSTYGLGNTYPAYYVSWNDIQSFITALNTHITNTGQGTATMRLPSEAEWEYACRAGTTTRFYFGDSIGCDATDCSDCAAGVLTGNRSDYMWFCGNASNSMLVGERLPNAFGLYDMSGNLWELCEDDYHSSYTGAPTNGSAWVEDPRDSYRVLRGGSWNSFGYRCRSAGRISPDPASRNYYIGFRISATVNCDPDSSPPVITLIGDASATIECGDAYIDAGATASDLCDGDLTGSILVGGDTVDSAIPGSYVITYNVSDAFSNAAVEVTRSVVVENNCPEGEPVEGEGEPVEGEGEPVEGEGEPVEGEGEPVEGEGEPVEGEGEPIEGEGEPVEGEGEPVEGEGEPVEGEGEPVEGEGEPVEGEGEPVEGEGEPVEGEGEPCNTDTEDPVISQCATNQTVVANVEGIALVPEFADVVASDNCTLAETLTRTQSPEADTQVEMGEHEITITITDEAGNTADCTATLTVTPWPWRFGDATLDGSINLADATEALRLATGGTPTPGKEDSLVTADVDQNGAVTRADMLSIFAFVQSGGIVTEVPKNLIAQSGVNEIILLWGPVPHDNVRGYIVERRIEGESAWTRLPETEDPVYYDQEIASARYEYRVAVIDMLGNVETFSDSVTVLGNTLILWAPWAQGLAGDTVVAPIGIGSTRGLNPSDVSITATYDTSIVEYQDVLTTVLSKNLQFIVDTSVPGAITIFATAPQGQLPIGEGRFFDLQMKLKEDAPDGCKETLITSAVIGNASGGGINTESQPGAICVGDVRWGDLDDDGVVTIADAQLVLDIITRNETFTNELLFKCDMNGDRRIDAADAVLILRLARGLSINPEQDSKALTEKEFSSRLVSLPDAVEVPKDCQFLLPVTVDDASELAGMDLVISYTRADLRCDAVCATPATNGYELNTELGTGYVRVSLGDATALPSGETVIAYMIFTAIGEETVENVRPPARVRINYAELKGELGESFRWYGDITRQNAEVTILEEGNCETVPDCDELSGNEGEEGFGSLQVYLGPAAAVTAGAQWRRVGTSTWLNNEYTETNIPLGAYQVEYKEINCWTAPEAMDVLIQAGAAPATAVGTYATAECEDEGESVEGEAEISASIVCSVIDDSTDEKITNAVVQTIPATVTVTENDNGIYTFLGISSGTYTVSVTANGYHSSSQIVSVAEGDMKELIFRLVAITGQEGEGEPSALEEIANSLLDQFDAADTNGDGQLSYDEAHGVIPDLDEDQFNELDADGDGFLTRDELEAYLDDDDKHCGCCKRTAETKIDIKRYIGDWLLVGLSLLVMVALTGRKSGRI